MYSIYTFSRKIGSTIASSGISFALSAIGYVAGTNVTQSAATIDGYYNNSPATKGTTFSAGLSYNLVTLIPVATCVLELIGIGLIFNLNHKQTNQMYAELAERRSQKERG